MKKNYVKTVLCVPVFLWIMGACILFAQEVEDEPKRKKDGLHWSLGISAEGNMNVPKGYALGAGLYGMFVLPDWVKTGRFSAGVKLLYSTEFKRYGLFDTAVLFRWNFYDFTKVKSCDSGFFVQAEGGISLGWNGKTAKPFVFGLGEGTFGYRFAVKNFFIEPYIRGGYPVIWAAGISGGFRI